MSTEQNKQLVRRYYEDIVNGAKVDELPKFLSPSSEVPGTRSSGDTIHNY
jgi:hypothetical protein